MNGAKADDSVKMINRARKSRNSKIGVNSQRLEVLRKYQNSPKMENLSFADLIPLIRLIY